MRRPARRDVSTTITEVDLEPITLIDATGSPTAESRYSRDLPAETLCWLYELMVVTRDLDGEFVNLQRQGELALFPSCRGQEAAQVGGAACLRKSDWLFPQYRELGVLLLRGIPPGNVGLAWRGTWHGGLEFTKKCVATMSIPIGTHALHAVGAAMASQRLRMTRSPLRSSATVPQVWVTCMKPSTSPRCSKRRAFSTCRTINGRSQSRFTSSSRHPRSPIKRWVTACRNSR